MPVRSERPIYTFLEFVRRLAVNYITDHIVLNVVVVQEY